MLDDRTLRDLAESVLPDSFDFAREDWRLEKENEALAHIDSQSEQIMEYVGSGFRKRASEYVERFTDDALYALDSAIERLEGVAKYQGLVADLRTARADISALSEDLLYLDP